MNTDCELEHSRVPVINGTGSRGAFAPRNDRVKTRNHAPDALPLTSLATVVEAHKVIQPPKVVLLKTGTLSNGALVARTPPTDPPLGLRQIAFRCVRLALAGGVVSAAVFYARTVYTTVRSEEGWINAEITALRAPIAGQVRLEALSPGSRIAAGQTLFTVENARFGNEQAVSQLNWVSELAQRLQAERDEAAVRLRRQEERTRLHEKMYAEQIIPRLELVEEQSQLELAQTVLSNKIVLARKAAERVSELTRQVQLQETAVVKMPFDGVAWAISAKAGAQVALHETVVETINPERLWVDACFHERHAGKLTVGAEVDVELEPGGLKLAGRVESVRGAAGRAASAGCAMITPEPRSPRAIFVRVRIESANPMDANQFYGVGRRVVVTVRE